MDIGKQTKIEMDKYDTLQKIVDQLEYCNYETDGRCLTNNVAFLKLKEMAIEQQRISNTPILCEVAMKIRNLEWSPPDIMVEGELRWEAKPIAQMRYIACAHEDKFEGIFLDGNHDIDDNYAICDTIQEAKEWCQKHWKNFVLNNVVIIEDGDLA